jgi:hypothetical protein
MAKTINTLNFYVVQMNEGSYNLYNALTDKELYFDVDVETIKSFLSLNSPTHPFFIEYNSTKDFLFGYDSIDNDGNRYQLDYDPSLFDSSIEYTDYTSDFSTQTNFVLINRDEEEESLDEYDEELPELPEPPDKK